MAYNEALAIRVRGLLKRRRNLTERKMFGGVGFLLNGNMCCGVLNSDLILRLGPKRGARALEDEPHARPFDITGRAMQGWIMLAPAGTENQAALKTWLRHAATFAASLPPK